MKTPRISIICALAKDRAIGKDSQLLWHIPNDLKRFKELTLDHPIIMGRKTYESIGKALPRRTNIVITSQKGSNYNDCLIYHSLKEALDKAKEVDKEEIFVIGGGQIYAQALSQTDRLYLTVVDGEYEADTFFPDYSEFTKVVSDQQEENGEHKYRYLTLEK